MIYFFQSGHKGPIKIGRSLNPNQRLKDMQHANPYKLKLLKATLCPKEEETESILHRAFREYKTQGEWFEPNPKLLLFIKTLPSPRATNTEIKLALENDEGASLFLLSTHTTTSELNTLKEIFSFLCNRQVSISLIIPFLFRLTERRVSGIAWEAGVSRQFVNQVINGKRQSLSVRQAITKALGFNPWAA